MGFDPVSIGLGAIGVAGAGMNAAGSMMNSNASASNYEYQAQVAANNAIIAQQNATWASEMGDVAATNKGMQTRQTVGSIRASQGASGIDVNTGSAVDVQAGAATAGMSDVQTIRSNAARESYGYQVQGYNDMTQAMMDRQAARKTREAAPIGALGSFLSGISSVGAQWGRYQNVSGSGNGSGSA